MLYPPNGNLSASTQAFVLAGGRGTRMHGLTYWIAKPALPVAGPFRLIDFPLSNCRNSGIRKVGILAQYQSWSLISHIKQEWYPTLAENDVLIEVLPAKKCYEGTADALFQNIDYIREHSPENVLILSGDHICMMNYGPIIAHHECHGADLTIACIDVPIEEARRFGVISMDEQFRIVQFNEKPNHPIPIPGNETRALVSMGVYVFSTPFLIEMLIRDSDNKDSRHDFGRDVIPALIDEFNVIGYSFGDAQLEQPSTYWCDVGTVDSFWQASMDLVGGTPDIYDEKWPIGSNMRLFLPAKITTNTKGQGATVVDSIFSTGCIVGAHSILSQSVILPDIEIGANCKITKAVITKSAIEKKFIIPDGTVIGHNLEEDKKRFDVSPKGVVLVTQEMLDPMVWVG